MFILYFYRSYKDYLEALFLWEGLYFYMCMVNTYSKGKDQSGKVINPARGQLNNRENDFPCPPSRLRIWSRETGSGSPVPRQPAHPILRLNLVLSGFLPCYAVASIYLFKPPYAIVSVPSLSGHATTYRWRSLPRVRRHRASKPQGNSKRWQVTMDQLTCASLSQTHFLYEVGMLKVPYILLKPPSTPS